MIVRTSLSELRLPHKAGPSHYTRPIPVSLSPQGEGSGVTALLVAHRGRRLVGCGAVLQVRLDGFQIDRRVLLRLIELDTGDRAHLVAKLELDALPLDPVLEVTQRLGNRCQRRADDLHVRA